MTASPARLLPALLALGTLGTIPSPDGYDRVFDEASPTSWRADVDATRLATTLEELTGRRPLADGTTAVSRNIHHPDHEPVAEHLRAALEAALQSDRGSVTVEAFEGAGETGLRNLVAELPARNLPWDFDGAEDPVDPRPVVLAAHFDSIASAEPEGTWDPARDPAPGADDDASGVAAVLEVARLLSAWEGGFAHPIRFVLFDAEEYGLLGSRHHVEQLLARDEEAALAIVLDPVGYDPGDSNVLWFLHQTGQEPTATSVEALIGPARSALEVRGLDGALLGDQARRSDHAPFWDAGFAALHFGSFPQPPTYHTTDDDLDVVDLDFLVEVTAFAAALTAREAGIRDNYRDARDPEAGRCSTVGAPASPLLFALLALLPRRRRNSA